MRVLVGCEESGVVREAFRAKGHDAWSNDIIPARDNGPHILGDVFEAINMYNWDLIILHPPCTALSVSGNKTYGAGKEKNYLRKESLIWTKELFEQAKIKATIGVCLENPVGVLWKYLDETPQYVQPWMFGHTEQKKTGLLLHNLPRLHPTNNVYEEMMKLPRKEREKIFYMSPSKDRGKERSVTYKGIAEAMAEQWG